MADENVTLQDLHRTVENQMSGLRFDVMNKLDIVCRTVSRLQTDRVAGQAADSSWGSELEELKAQYAQLGQRISRLEAR